MTNKLLYLIAIIFITASYRAFPEEVTVTSMVRDIPSSTKMLEMDKYDVKFYFIDLDVTNTTTFLSGSTTVNIVAKEDGLENIFLQLSGRLTVSSVSANNQPVSFTHKDDFLKIALPAPVNEGAEVSVMINYSGKPAKGKGINSSKDRQWDQTVLWTLSESSNAYNWFPVKQDLKDKADSAYIYVTVPKNLKAVSNGVLSKITDAGNNKLRYEWVTRFPTAYYLLSIVVGDYTEYKLTDTLNGKVLSLPNYVYNSPGCLSYYQRTIDYTPFLIDFYSYLYIPYPFAGEKFGQVMAPFSGGMEHQTVTMLRFYSFGLMAHELSHQWFGDYVTCSTWQDIWVNEGFATYSEYLVYEFASTPETSRAWLDDARRMAMRKSNSSIYLTPKETENESRLFDYNLSYMKGAMIIHMLRKEIDDDPLFFNVLTEYLNEFGNRSASARDFIDVLNRVTANDYSWFFDQWYYGKGYPKITGKYSLNDNQVKLELTQQTTSSDTPFFRMNVDIRLFNGDDHSDTTVVWTSNDQVFQLSGKGAVTSVVIDPSGELLASIKNISTDK